MARKQTEQSAVPVMMYSFIGNLGCIRFPPPVRKISGIKRGDHLAVVLQDNNIIHLEKLEASSEESTSVRVDGCACEVPPQACFGEDAGLVTVGWSYIQLDPDLATRLGFLPDSPIKLVGEPSRITVTLHTELRDLEGIPHLACPP